MSATTSMDLVIQLDGELLQGLEEHGTIGLEHPGDMGRILIFYREEGWGEGETAAEPDPARPI